LASSPDDVDCHVSHGAGGLRDRQSKRSES
jgi:hypothetical protein